MVCVKMYRYNCIVTPLVVDLLQSLSFLNLQTMSFNNRLILGTLSGGSVIISLKGSEDSKKFRKNASNACLPDLPIFVQ